MSVLCVTPLILEECGIALSYFKFPNKEKRLNPPWLTIVKWFDLEKGEGYYGKSDPIRLTYMDVYQNNKVQMEMLQRLINIVWTVLHFVQCQCGRACALFLALLLSLSHPFSFPLPSAEHTTHAAGMKRQRQSGWRTIGKEGRKEKKTVPQRKIIPESLDWQSL